MRRCFFLAVLAVFFLVSPAEANLKYYSDPVYKKLNDEDHHPMDDMRSLAEQGDVRAQFILGDLFSKGKGGYAKDVKEARRWFEESAIHGYSYSFIRLAAISKREKKYMEAWQWYTLAIRYLDDDSMREYAVRARNELAESRELTEEEMDKARENIRAWEDTRSSRLEAEEKDEKKKTAALEKDKPENRSEP